MATDPNVKPSQARLTRLLGHFGTQVDSSQADGLKMQSTGSSTSTGKNSLTIRDNRTGKEYTIEITDNQVVKAKDFGQIRFDSNDKIGLRVYDPGLLSFLFCFFFLHVFVFFCHFYKKDCFI